MKHFLLIIIMLLTANLLLLGVFIYKTKPAKTLPGISAPALSEQTEPGKVIDSIGEAEPILLRATVKKEPIPQELELGDFWYWLYFDEPHLLVNNAAGVPMYINKIQANTPIAADFYDIEDFVDKKVEVYGYQTWGYAESSVFQIISLREL